jgi:hypothetical protein
MEQINENEGNEWMNERMDAWMDVDGWVDGIGQEHRQNNTAVTAQ